LKPEGMHASMPIGSVTKESQRLKKDLNKTLRQGRSIVN
jgi:hypothetical protein